jgi:hypothetical protein
MTPKILFVGYGQGSWEVRGRQIGKALGARATSTPTADDWRWADVAILVKRAVDQWGSVAKGKNIPVIWDVLDYWQQPEQNQQQPYAYSGAIKRIAKSNGIDRLIGATQAMADDIGGVYIPHHYRPGLPLTEPRGRVRVIAYEGTRKYLGAWLAEMERCAAARDMRVAVNPSTITEADVIVSFRHGVWDGPICRRWKSGVKFVNALAAGKPVIAQSCAAMDEIDPVGVRVESVLRFGDVLGSVDAIRDEAYQVAKVRRREFAIETIAAQYRSLACSVLEVAA